MVHDSCRFSGLALAMAGILVLVAGGQGCGGEDSSISSELGTEDDCVSAECATGDVDMDDPALGVSPSTAAPPAQLTCVPYFSETFANNSQGWTLGKEWQIGPTGVSVAHQIGYPDPAQDHTPTTDNGVAGVVLKGNAMQVTHSYRYLTSPSIDLTTASGPVYLEFWRWLNSDSTPWMQNAIQVYNGSGWVTIWQSASPAIMESAWTKVVHDVTAYKNPAFQVRFGMSIDVGEACYSVSSWNIDDLRLMSDVNCP